MKKYFIGKSLAKHFIAEKIGGSYYSIPLYSNGTCSNMTYYSQKNDVLFFDDLNMAVKKFFELKETEKEEESYNPWKNIITTSYSVGEKTENGWVRSFK